MNNENFLINDFDLEIAKDICKFINDNELRNRAAANASAAVFAKKYFQDTEIDTESGLHNVCQVLEDIEISDIYIKDNYIDVRLYFDDNGIFVPKSHFDNNLLPVAYMFIKINAELSQGLVTGFILPSSVNTENDYNGYYKINENDIVSYYDIQSSFINKFEDELPIDTEKQIHEYLDGRLSDKKSFYQILINSKEARLKLINAARAKALFNFISIPQAETNNDETDYDEHLETEELSESFELETDGSLEELSINNDFDDISLDDSSDTIENLTEIEPDSDSTDLSETNDVEIGLLESFNEQEQPLEEEFEAETIDIDSFDEPEVINEENEAENNSLGFDDILDETFVENNNSFAQELDVVEELEDTTIENEAVTAFEYSTNITPSIDTYEAKEVIEEPIEQAFDTEEETEDGIPAEDESIEPEELEEIDDASEENEEIAYEGPNEEIDTLFNNNEEETAAIPVTKPKKRLLPIISAVVIIAGISYYGYTKFFTGQVDNNSNTIDSTTSTAQIEPQQNSKENISEAMPVETVENINLKLTTDAGNSVSIPAIEKNLDASIAISNLSIDFVVPTAYKSNKTAARYFSKIGKIIQLNLKTEMLLLTKQPITNRIEVELEYNKGTHSFDVKNILSSSGEKSIDDLIVQTIKSALSINLNMNMNVFNNISGNPVLVIKL